MQKVLVGAKESPAAGFIGRYMVGSGEDMHLTSPVFLDYAKPHVMLITGKRGSGKSYAAGVILEEFLQLSEEYRNNLCFVVVDPMGIYWSLKFPNKEQKKLLDEWKLVPQGFENVSVIIPQGLGNVYENLGIVYDDTLTIATNEISGLDWIRALKLRPESEEAVALLKTISRMSGGYDIEDIIEAVKDDASISKKTKDYLSNIFTIVNNTGIFTKKGKTIEDLIKPGFVVILDLSQIRKELEFVQELIVMWLSKNIYARRVEARKLEEKSKIEKRDYKSSFPLVWLVLEEAHNFVSPSSTSPSAQEILRIAKQGREPGIGLITITQMPNKIHSDVLRQTDIVFCFRLTSKEDIEALHLIAQTYEKESIEKSLAVLPKNPGACIVLDDNSERVFRMQFRPRVSWHAGATAAISV